MVLLQIKNVDFTLFTGEKLIESIDLEVNAGDFHIIFGPSGSGKTTLLKVIQRGLATNGVISGEMILRGQSMDDLTAGQIVQSVAYVQQNPNEQIIFEDVIQELTFVLENLAFPSEEIELKIAEIVNFFGMQSWLHEKTSNLSGGQKQLLNLASVLIANPTLLLLDEPTSQLDPLAAKEFIDLLKRINDELGTTILIIEHRLELLFPLASHVTLMQKGSVSLSCERQAIFQNLSVHSQLLKQVLPPALLLAYDLRLEDRPFTVREGIQMLQQLPLEDVVETKPITRDKKSVFYEMKNCSFRYQRLAADIVKNVNLTLYKGTITTIFGNNGSGKTTLLKLMGGQKQAYKGTISIYGKKIKKVNAMKQKIASLPQDPSVLFIEKTVEEDFKAYCKQQKIAEKTLLEIVDAFEIQPFMTRHPDDLSGGELQKVALAKLLLASPNILLLDEPTKGLDAFSKNKLAEMLLSLKKKGLSIVIVSHDLDFSAEIADGCTLFFDGRLLQVEEPHAFFNKTNFYTPTVTRLAKPFFKGVILYEELLLRCQQSMKENEYVSK
ncbi:MAG: ABC transporter ATP-binding protein [Kurthia sp.]|nr:ABC transporter ATP-binding protein [Candidatus Kurthia equi]